MPIEIPGNAQAAKEAAQGGAPLPEGSYLFNIFNVEEAEYGENTANAGKPRLIVTLKVAEGDYKGRQVKDFGVPLFPNWASGAVAHTFYQFAKAVGGEVDEDGNVSFPVDEWTDLQGETIKARISHEDYQGSPRARVQRYLAPDTDVSAAPVKEPVAPKANRFTTKKADDKK